MHKYAFLIGMALTLFACQNNQPKQQSSTTDSETSILEKEEPKPPAFDIQGHRGMRGYYPENTIEGFIFALGMGVTTLEMDAVITKDKEVILSHEPWFSAEICADLQGKPISKEKERTYNIYQMNYNEVETYKCGGFNHPRFPEQEKVEVVKPRLADVIDAVENQVEKSGGNPVYYNIETKTNPKGDGIFHPKPDEFVDLLLNVVKQKYVAERTIIQSFDIRTLQEVRKLDPSIKVALLVGMGEDKDKKFEELGFKPDIYSPNFELLDKSQIEELHKQNIKVIPWTVNEEADIIELINMGVDGIISDFPDRVAKASKEMASSTETVSESSL